MDKLNISAFLRVVERTVYQMIRQTGQGQGRAGSPLIDISPRSHSLWVSPPSLALCLSVSPPDTHARLHTRAHTHCW